MFSVHPDVLFEMQYCSLMIEIKICMDPVALRFYQLHEWKLLLFSHDYLISTLYILQITKKNWSIATLDSGILFFHCTTFVIIIWLN